METFDLDEAAERIGIGPTGLRQLVELEILSPAEGRFTPGHLRRAGLVKGLTGAGVPVEGLGAAIRAGTISLDFLDAPAFERFSVLSGATFADAAARTGVPVELLMFVREASGSPAATPSARIRDAELVYIDLVETTLKAGFRPAAIRQMLRTHGEGLRRVAETESAIWQSEVIAPAMGSGKRPDQVLGIDFGDQMAVLIERAVVAMYHLQQTRAWTTEIIGGLEVMLAEAGLHTYVEHPPAMCFLDITGYTRHTQVHGDAAAALLAEELGGVVQRISIAHRGHAVKWLGDGVMLHYPDPAEGVSAALEMVAGVVEAGLPPAHVGLHAGPVIFQEGDYYGQTVNVAARIAARAGPGQVLVSQAVVDASAEARIAFRDIGPVELKGVTGAVRVYEAEPPG